MTTFMKVLSVSLSVGALTAGCVTDEANDEPTVGVIFAPGIREGQGRYVLGGIADGYAGPAGHVFAVHDVFDGQPVYVKNACVTRSPNGPCEDLPNATSTGSDGSSIRIAGRGPGTPATTRIYDVWRNNVLLCPDGAYPTAGAWTTTGFHNNLAGYLSFGCLDPGGDSSPALSNHQGGLSGKPIAWGFVPGPIGSPAWKQHQLATTMGRSDYCGDGTVRTIEATGIKHYLPNQGPPHGPLPGYPQTIVDGAFYPEAAWATAANNESRGATCLAKLRWSTRRVGDICNALPDPRLHAVEEGAGFCDDMTLPEVWASGATIFNDSQYNTVGLWQWAKAGDHYASSGGFYAGVRPSETVLPPGAGPAYSSTDTAFLGTLLTNDGKITWLARYPGATLVELVTAKHQSNGDWITTIASAVPAGYTTSRHEGWLFTAIPADQPPGATFTRLYRHKQIAGPDFMVSANATEAGFQNPVPLGYAVEL